MWLPSRRGSARPRGCPNRPEDRRFDGTDEKLETKWARWSSTICIHATVRVAPARFERGRIMCQWLTEGVLLLALVTAFAHADEPPTPTAEAAAAWEYPGAKNLMGSEGFPAQWDPKLGIHVT